MGSFRYALLILPLASLLSLSSATKVCVIGSGIAGATVSHFLTQYSSGSVNDIVILERNGVVGGRMATVTIGGDTFEAGASILHPKNIHAVRFVELLGLDRSPEKDPDYSSWVGIWDGSQFVFQTSPPATSVVYKWILSVIDAFRLFWRYGVSLLRMNRFVGDTIDKFLLYYKDLEARPVFETVEEMLKWSGLYNMTQRTLQEELADAKLSELLISELVTVITRINYGQNVSMSGLAGAVSLAGSDSGLWSVDGGNWQIAAELIKLSNATLHLHEEVTSVTCTQDNYELLTRNGNIYSCGVAVVATPLDELNISFIPPISIPNRKLQHTYTTFVRGVLNPSYFGLKSTSEIPGIIGTLEIPEIPFSSISVLKKYSEEDLAYKIFSRAPLDDELLNTIFSSRKETIKIDWPAYPHYHAPETYAPFILDDRHLYYINSFESGASTIETGAVAAENVARLILSRLKVQLSSAVTTTSSTQDHLHLDL